MAAAEAELVELERRSLAGERSTRERAKLERALLDARVQASQPWGPRREAIAAAMRDRDRDVHAFASEHFDELRAELEAEGAQTARAVERTAGWVVEASAREGVAARLNRLLSTAEVRVNPATSSIAAPRQPHANAAGCSVRVRSRRPCAGKDQARHGRRAGSPDRLPAA